MSYSIEAKLYAYIHANIEEMERKRKQMFLYICILKNYRQTNGPNELYSYW